TEAGVVGSLVTTRVPVLGCNPSVHSEDLVAPFSWSHLGHLWYKRESIGLHLWEIRGTVDRGVAAGKRRGVLSREFEAVTGRRWRRRRGDDESGIHGFMGYVAGETRWIFATMPPQ